MTPTEFAAYLRGFRAALGDRALTDDEWSALIAKAESVQVGPLVRWPACPNTGAPPYLQPFDTGSIPMQPWSETTWRANALEPEARAFL